jgi:type IV fimbrial biogenesis protein FimT
MHMMRQRTRDAGFTLIELVMVMSIAGVLGTVGIFGFANWRQTQVHLGSAQQLVSSLRNTAELAISEGRTYCVDIDSASNYQVWRYTCSTGTLLSGTAKPQSSKISYAATLTLPSPAPACASGHACLYFYPRGTAIPATIRVTSTQRSQVYTIHVEGLTARVYM